LYNVKSIHSIYQNIISIDFYRILVQYILESTDPLIQIAFINTLTVVEQRYPTNSTNHFNELLDLGRQTRKIKISSIVLVFFSFDK
jgi:hypothetical protein